MKRFLFIELCAFTKAIEGIYIIVTVDAGCIEIDALVV